MNKTKQQNRQEFAEDFGILFESMGFPCMAGRIWGWLLTSDPPHQTAAEIAEGVGASRGSVSTMTAHLMQFGFIERVGLPGRRSKFYRVKKGAFAEILTKRMQFTTAIRTMAERGLELVKDKPPEVRRHLKEYAEICAFFEKEMPGLIKKWETEKKRKGK
jgi:DNA-binding transcriptional regulator GbsR (MarR family)